MQTQRTIWLGIAAGSLILGVVGTGWLTAQAQSRTVNLPLPRCKLSPIEAITAATRKVPGRALQSNFEMGREKWFYGVIVLTGKKLHEVHVDPLTGKVGKVEEVTPASIGNELQEKFTCAVEGKIGKTGETGEKEDDD